MNEQVVYDILVKDLGSSKILTFMKNAEMASKRVPAAFSKMEIGANSLSKRLTRIERQMKSIGRMNTGKKSKMHFDHNLKDINSHLDKTLSKINRINSASIGGGSSRNSRSPSRNGGGGGMGGMMSGRMLARGGLIGAGLYGGAKLAGQVIDASKTGMTYESKVVDVRSLLERSGDFSALKFANLQRSSKEASGNSIFTAINAASAQKYLAMAGMDTTQIKHALPSTLDVAAIDDSVGLAESADIITNVMSSFQLEASKTSTASDMLVRAFTSSNANLRELGESIAYSGSIAKGAGEDLTGTLAAIGALSKGGIKGSRAGVGVKNIISQSYGIASSASKSKLAKKLGIRTLDENGKFVGLENLVEQMNKKNVSVEHILKLFGQIGGAALTTLRTVKDEMGNLEITSLGKKIADSQGVAAEVAAKKMSTFSGSVDKMKSQFEQLQINLSNGVNPLFKKLIDAGTDFLSWINKKLEDTDVETAKKTSTKAEESLGEIFATRGADKKNALIEIFKRDYSDFSENLDFSKSSQDIQKIFIENVKRITASAAMDDVFRAASNKKMDAVKVIQGYENKAFMVIDALVKNGKITSPNASEERRKIDKDKNFNNVMAYASEASYLDDVSSLGFNSNSFREYKKAKASLMAAEANMKIMSVFTKTNSGGKVISKKDGEGSINDENNSTSSTKSSNDPKINSFSAGGGSAKHLTVNIESLLKIDNAQLDASLSEDMGDGESFKEKLSKALTDIVKDFELSY